MFSTARGKENRSTRPWLRIQFDTAARQSKIHQTVSTKPPGIYE
jgi:hypothetical protein